ncbi:hypothetical protein CDL12_13265 [Handroanthus impetiginosus]|uniref:Vacuolar proton pump subunit H n=1 Tax=Handroanthus impetiginosus TaxID=429701 RepID=A0A2G9H9B5_9LAMI|nr:hypothetical protein CDL12_13265 [Handroanthus impetiginosus]
MECSFPTYSHFLRRDIPWETYMTTKLITGTGLQLLRRYAKKPENYKAQLLDDDLQEALNQLEEGLKDNIKKLSSFDKYKQEVLLGHLDWSPMHRDPIFWRDNITNFEEHDFQILRVLLTILDASTDPRTLAVACYDLSQFIQYHPAGRIIVTDLRAKDRVMKMMNHENAEVTKNALLCIQRLFLGAKYASFLQA